jgi:tetratricopeptide (TPR) repeat protein
MVLHRLTMLALLAWGLGLTSQASANTLRGVRFGQHGTLSRVVFDLQQEVSYRLEAGPDPYTIRIVFPALDLPTKLQLVRARDALIQEVRLSTTSSQVIGDIILKQPGTVQHEERVRTPPRVVVDIAQGKDGAVQRGGKREAREVPVTPQQGKAAAEPRATEANTSGLPMTNDPQATSRTAPAASPAPVSALTPTQLLEQAEKLWAARQIDAAQRSYTTFLRRYPEHPNNHLIAARVADILRTQEHYHAALEAYTVVVQGYPGSEGAIISQIRMAELGATFPDLLPSGDEPRYAAYRHPLQTLQRLMSDYPFAPLADVARFKLGEMQLQQSDRAAALSTFQQLLRRPLPDTLRHDVEQSLRQALGRQLDDYQRQGAFFDVLRTFFAYKLSLPPAEIGHPDLLYPVTASYAQLGLFDEAQNLLPTVLDAATTPLQRAHMALVQAMLFAQSGRSDVVIALLTPVQQFTDPTMRGQALLLLTESAWRAQRTDDVVQYATLGETLLTGAVERTKFFTILGQAYEAQGEADKALQTFHKCAEIPNAGDPAETCVLRAAILHAAQGQQQAALALYERVLQTFPNSNKEGLLFRLAESHRQQSDTAQMLATFTRLRESTNDAFWQKVATEYLAQAQWQERLQERLAVFQNSLMR